MVRRVPASIEQETDHDNGGNDNEEEDPAHFLRMTP
jgi:hypothetical protein